MVKPQRQWEALCLCAVVYIGCPRTGRWGCANDKVGILYFMKSKGKCSALSLGLAWRMTSSFLEKTLLYSHAPTFPVHPQSIYRVGLSLRPGVIP